jgi:hypothetical protein
MSDYAKTANIGLNLPAGTDAANIPLIYNENMEIIDLQIAQIKNKGASNAGKFMVVDSSGNVVPTTVPFANGVSF